MAKILLKFKEKEIREIPVDKVLTIGRNSSADIHIDNPVVSGFHAKIWKEDDKFFVEDTDSRNGTFVNGKRIIRAALINGDEITIGRHTLCFVSEPEDTRTPAPEKMHSLDETMVLDPKLRDQLLGKKD